MSKCDDARFEAIRIAWMIKHNKTDKQVIEDIENDVDDDEDDDEIEYQDFYHDLADENTVKDLPEGIEVGHDNIVHLLKNLPEIEKFSLEEEMKLKQDKYGNLIPEEEDEEVEPQDQNDPEEPPESDQADPEEIQAGIHACDEILELLPDHYTVYDALADRNIDQDIFYRLTDAATIISFLSIPIYKLRRPQVENLKNNLIQKYTELTK